MIVALIDNGSLAPAAHVQLRAVAAALSERTGTMVHAVSWKHSDRIPVRSLALAATEADGAIDHDAATPRGVTTPQDVATSVSEWMPSPNAPAWTLAPFVRARVARGERHFVFLPYFISAQGAIGSALRGDLEKLQGELGGFEFTFADGLAARDVLADIVADRIRASLTFASADRAADTPVILVDHGGPSPASAALRDALAQQLRARLVGAIGPLAAASMEGAHGPLLADQLRAPGFAGHDILVALLFLAPGRHAGPRGDVARICQAAAARCTFTEPVGTHPLALDALADALRDTLFQFHAESLA